MEKPYMYIDLNKKNEKNCIINIFTEPISHWS